MALLSNSKEGRVDGGYTRLLGNSELGALISQIHATSISAGTELERLISEKHTNLMTEDLFSDFIGHKLSNGVYLVPKKVIKSVLHQALNTSTEPDFIVIVVVDKKAYITELKDGDTFDTKKAAGEVLTCRNFAQLFKQYLIKSRLHYDVLIRICCFNQDSREAIVKGFKNEIKITEAWTGRDFCREIGISYENIIQQRKVHQEENLSYFIERMLDIDDVREKVINILDNRFSYNI